MEAYLSADRQVRTTNIIEQGFKEVKRRVKVMETFPSEGSCIRILYSLLRLQNENWEGKPIANFQIYHTNKGTVPASC
ncbi:MAG: hypothetical protein B5M53_05010 [Candidatus Cloacimonas sp. 4484_209]|nr:MAG: hypothetical protein B5M53_05010 [Candidatus Cloacimonas sp. 4484_209]